MAKIRGAKTVTFDPSVGATAYRIYVAPAGQADFLAKADLKPEEGGLAPFAQITASPWVTKGLAEGRWQLALTAMDAEQNESDPYQAAGWVDFPLDLTAPLPPSNGSIS